MFCCAVLVKTSSSCKKGGKTKIIVIAMYHWCVEQLTPVPCMHACSNHVFLSCKPVSKKQQLHKQEHCRLETSGGWQVKTCCCCPAYYLTHNIKSTTVRTAVTHMKKQQQELVLCGICCALFANFCMGNISLIFPLLILLVNKD